MYCYKNNILSIRLRRMKNMQIILFVIIQSLIVVSMIVYFSLRLNFHKFYDNQMKKTPYQIGLGYKDKYNKILGDKFKFALNNMKNHNFAMYQYNHKTNRNNELAVSFLYFENKNPAQWTYNVQRQTFYDYTLIQPVIIQKNKLFEINISHIISGPNTLNKIFITLPESDIISIDTDRMKFKTIEPQNNNIWTNSQCIQNKKIPVTCRMYKQMTRHSTCLNYF